MHPHVSVLFEVGQAFGLSEHLTQFLWRVAAVSQTLMMMKRVRGLWGWRQRRVLLLRCFSVITELTVLESPSSAGSHFLQL